MLTTTTQILLVILGGIMGFCLHGIISPREPNVECYVIKIPKEDDDDKEETE